MDMETQLVQVPMDWADQLAWAAAAVGISLTASLILLGIWRRGYREIEQETGSVRTLRDDGVMWMFLACTLWCATYVLQVVALVLFPRAQPNSSALPFIRVVLSLTNSLFFVLATANIDAVKEASSFPARFLRRIRAEPFWILVSLVLVATTLCWLTGPSGRYCQGFDALTNVLTVLLITWGFFKSFQKRNFPIIAWLSVLVFSIFMVAELGELLHAINPAFLLARHQLFGTALSVGSDGTVSLLFIALTFSWVHEKSETWAEIYIADIGSVPTRDPKAPEHTVSKS
jgi:hypothetical protein